MTVYGYIRVSTTDQNVARQIETMTREGVPEENMFIDRASGKNFDRPEYKRLLETVTTGDKIIVDSLDRLGRDYDGLIAEWKRLTREKGVHIRALDLTFMDSEAFAAMDDLGMMIEDMLLSVLSWSAANERNKMLRRQAEGIAVAKAAGKYKGRQKTVYSKEVMAEAQQELEAHGKCAAARVLGVNRNTIYRMIEDGRLVA